jgi:hypothetical protein
MKCTDHKSGIWQHLSVGIFITSCLFSSCSGIGLCLGETSVYKNPFTCLIEDTLISVDNWRNNTSDVSGNAKKKN